MAARGKELGAVSPDPGVEESVGVRQPCLLGSIGDQMVEAGVRLLPFYGEGFPRFCLEPFYVLRSYRDSPVAVGIRVRAERASQRDGSPVQDGLGVAGEPFDVAYS